MEKIITEIGALYTNMQERMSEMKKKELKLNADIGVVAAREKALTEGETNLAEEAKLVGHITDVLAAEFEAQRQIEIARQEKAATVLVKEEFEIWRDAEKAELAKISQETKQINTDTKAERDRLIVEVKLFEQRKIDIRAEVIDEFINKK